MRYYDITIGDLHYTSLGADGLANPGSLQVELDFQLAASDVATSAHMRIWGCGLDDISQAKDLVNQQVLVSGGMSPGLPLANPSQAGYLCAGTVLQAFGNWVGTDQTLDVIVTGTGLPNMQGSGGGNPLPATRNIVMDWKKGQDVGEAIQKALEQGFPGFSVDLQIGQYKAPSDQPHFAGTIDSFAKHIRQYTQYLGGAQTSQATSPQGVALHFQPDGKTISVFDGSQQSGAGTIDYQDLIGQPTWIGVDKISIKLVMRGDLHVGSTITLPQTLVTNQAGAGSAQTFGGTNSPNTSLTFQGTFTIQNIHHFGNFRQPDAASWCTVVEATTVSGSS